MTATLTPDVVAAWELYEARNRRASAAYRCVALFACRKVCGADFASPSARQLHEQWCGK